jgi:hypothetical protein
VSFDRRLECTREAFPGRFEPAKLVQQNKIALRSNISLHCFGCGKRAGAVKMAIRRTGSQVVEYGKPFRSRDVSQEPGAAKPVGKPMAFRDKAGQANGRLPPVDLCSERVLDRRIWRAPDHCDRVYGTIHSTPRSSIFLTQGATDENHGCPTRDPKGLGFPRNELATSPLAFERL